jgi:SAM-dependent methyltransferase
LHPDAKRWNERYEHDLEYHLQRDPYDLVTNHLSLIPEKGTVLDAACGVAPLGELLIQCGLKVVALDVSFLAAQAARQRLLSKNMELACAVLDMTDPWLPNDYFAAIFNFYFLSRPLLDRFRVSLKPGGFAFFEILLWDGNPVASRQNYLLPGELERRFLDWQVHYVNEMWKKSRKKTGEPRKVLQLIVQKPGEGG